MLYRYSNWTLRSIAKYQGDRWAEPDKDMDNQRAADHARSQENLVTFLNSDLDLAFTMLQTAVITDSQAHMQQARSNVRNAIVTVRDLSRGLDDVKISAGINDRVDSLQAALDRLGG